MEMLWMASPAPTNVWKDAADSLRWAHYLSRTCCRCPHMRPLHLQQQLPMVLLGPITSRQAALPMPWFGPITFPKVCLCLCMGPFYSQLQQPITSLGPIMFLGGVADALGRAHYACNSIFQ